MLQAPPPSPAPPSTQRLLRDLRQRKATTVRVAGPIGAEATTDCNLVPAGAWERHEALVLIGGGVGVSF